MPKFRKLPVVIEAMRHDGDARAIQNYILTYGGPVAYADRIDNSVSIPTLEGEMKAMPGDWIIRDVNGEFYPCKPDIFAKTYEPVPEGR